MGGGPRYRNRVEADDSWREHAACRNYPKDWWYATPENPPLGPRKKTEAEKAAIRVCLGVCPVRAECLDYAVANVETQLIWAGMTGAELKTERRRRQREAQRERNRQEWRAAQ